MDEIDYGTAAEKRAAPHAADTKRLQRTSGVIQVCLDAADIPFRSPNRKYT
ncbi:hypothetical protein ACFHYQ_29255 [Sphaerimonospora cavernae]|uniref:Uncharacterized protein n=1 Tax=Sphaerimonospora cavernae TaxID=1740611 RepID=A0ABV6UE06_9ACTN